MRWRIPGSRGTVAVALALVAIVPASTVAQAQGLRAGAAAAASGSAPRTPWGHPDLQGTWDMHSITPLERPDAFAGREFLTDEEAAALEQQALVAATDEARQEGQRDVGTAYNDFWWDRATNVSGTKRTSLIVDPKDGRVPPLTPDAERRAAHEASRRPLRATGGSRAGRAPTPGSTGACGSAASRRACRGLRAAPTTATWPSSRRQATW